jgi:hypothetical protein
MKQKTGLPMITFMLGIILITFSLSNTIHFMLAHGNFRILSKYLVCEQPRNNRCLMHNRVITKNNVIADFVAGDHGYTKEGLIEGNHIKREIFISL